MTNKASEMPDCVLCDPSGANLRAGRYVWEDELWRVWTVTAGVVPGYSFLNSKRHIPHITDIDGAEAETLGLVLRRVSSALKLVTAAEVVYLHVFGDNVAHLHIHLAPHRAGDALASQILRGPVVEERLATGVVVQRSTQYPLVPEEQMRGVADRIATELAARPRSEAST